MVRFMTSVVLGVPAEHVLGRMAEKRYKPRGKSGSPSQKISYRESQLEMEEEDEVFVPYIEYPLGDCFFSVYLHFTIFENVIEHSVEVKIWKDAFQVRLLGASSHGRPTWARTVPHGPLICVAFSLEVTRTLSTDALTHLHGEQCSLVVERQPTTAGDYLSPPSTLYGPRAAWVRRWRETGPEAGAEVGAVEAEVEPEAEGGRRSPSRSASSLSSGASGESSGASEVMALRRAAPHARLQQTRFLAGVGDVSAATRKADRPEPFQRLFQQPTQVPDILVGEAIEDEDYMSVSTMLSEDPYYESGRAVTSAFPSPGTAASLKLPSRLPSRVPSRVGSAASTGGMASAGSAGTTGTAGAAGTSAGPARGRGAHGAHGSHGVHVHIVPLVPHRLFCRRAIASFKVDFPISIGNKSVSQMSQKTQRSDVSSSRSTRLTRGTRPGTRPGSALSGASHDSGRSARGTRATRATRITKASRGTVATREGGKAGSGANGGKAGKGANGGKAGKGGKSVKGGKGGGKGHGGGGGPQNAGGARAHLDGLPLRLEGAANKFFTDMRAMFLEPVYEDDLGRGAKLTAKKVQLRAMVSASDLMDEMQKAQLNPLMVHVSAVFNLPVKILSLHGFEKVLVRLRLPEAPDAAVRTTPRPLAETVRFDESFSALTSAIPPERLLSQLEHQRLAFEVVGLRPDNWRPQATPVVFGAAVGDAQLGTRPPIGAAGSCARAEAGACGVRAAVRLPPPLHVVLAEAEVDAAPLAHGRNVLHFCQPLRITAAHYGEGPGSLWDIHKLMEDWLGIADTTSASGNEPDHDLANEHLRTKADPPCQASPLTDGHFVESASYLQVEVGLVSDLRDAQSQAEGPRLTPASASTGGSGLGASRGESLESVARDTGIQPLLAVLWDRAAAVRLTAAAFNVNQEALGAFPPVGPLSQLAPRDPDAQLLHRELRLHQPELDSMSLSSLRRRLSRQTFPFADGDRRNVGGSRRGSNASETSCKLGYKRDHEAALVAALAAAATAAATAAAAAAAAAASASAAASAAEAQMQDSDENLSTDRQENLPPEPTLSPSDAVSGFVIDGIDIFFIYIEAPGGRALQPFLQEGMRLRPEEGRLLYHSELRTPTRRYAAFLQLGGILSIATRSPLLEMLRKKPTALLRGRSRSGCWEALWRLDLLRRAKLLRPVLQSGLLPTPRALLGLMREHGVPLRPAASADRKDLVPPPTPGTERPPTPPAHAAARRVLQALWPDGPAVDGEGPEATDEENARRGFGRRGRIHAVAHVLGQLQGLRPGEQEGDEALAGARPGASARAGEGAGAWLGAGAGAAAAARASAGGRVGAGMGAGAGARVGAGSGSGSGAEAGAGAGTGTGAGQGRRVGGSSSTPMPAVGALARGPQPPKRPRLLCNRCKRTPPLAWIVDAAAQAPRPPLPPSYKKGAFKSLYPTVSNIPSMMHTSDAEDLNMWLQRDEEEGEESPFDLKRKKKGKGSSSGKTDSTSVTTDSTKSTKKSKGKKGGGKKKDKSKLKDKSKDSGDSDKSKGKQKSDKLKKKDKSDKLEKKDLSDKTKGKELSDKSKDEDDNMNGKEKITDKDDSDKSKGRESSEKPEKESSDTLKGKESSDKLKIAENLDKLKVKESSDELKDKEGSDKLKGKERSDKLKGIEHSDKSKDEDDAEKSKGKGLFDKTKGKEMSGSTLGDASSTTKKKSTVTIAPFGSESMGKSDTSDTDLGRKSSSSKKSSKSSITLRGSGIGSIRKSIAKTPKTRPLTKKVDSEVQTELTVLQKKKGSVMYTRVSQPQIGRRTLPPLHPRSSSIRASTLSSPRDRQRSLSRRSSKRVSTAYSRQSKDLANRRSRGASMRTAGGN